MSKSKRAKWRGNVGSVDGNGASDGALPQNTSTAQGDGFSSIESAPAVPSDSSYVNLVKKPVRIETTEIELALHKCYDAAMPGFWRRASFSLWMSGLTTLITTTLSFVGFLYHMDETKSSWYNFFTRPMWIQIGAIIFCLVVGGAIEQSNVKRKGRYIKEAMRQYNGGGLSGTSR